MAGDWIKVEKATVNKPEILHLATLLGIDPYHALGVCIQFWCWCDDQLVKGCARNVTVEQLDRILAFPGFANALVKACWLQVRDGSLVIPNFDRHLSKSAKKRALSGRRVQDFRKRSQRYKSVTREEKRREEKKEIQDDVKGGDDFLRADSPFDRQPPSFPDPIARFPVPVQEQARRMLHDWHFWRYGTLPNLTSDATSGNLNTMAGVAESFGSESEGKLKEFMQRPPPGFPRTSPLYKVFKHLGMEAPDKESANGRQRNPSTSRVTGQSAGGGQYEGIAPRIAKYD